MNKTFALCFLIFASLLFAALETAAQKKPDSNKDSIEVFWKKQRA